MTIGARVRIVADGRVGVVTALVRTASCGCVTVFVRLERGEWAGVAAEVEVVA